MVKDLVVPPSLRLIFDKLLIKHQPLVQPGTPQYSMGRFHFIHVLSRERTDAPINYGRIDAQKLEHLKPIVTFSEYDIYPIFDLCGRAIPGMTALTDQAIGGLTMWVLAGFVEVFGLLFALATLMRLSAKNRLPNKQDIARRKQAVVAPAS